MEFALLIIANKLLFYLELGRIEGISQAKEFFTKKS